MMCTKTYIGNTNTLYILHCTFCQHQCIAKKNSAKSSEVGHPVGYKMLQLL